MAERKPNWPEVGDLVIATIETVTDYGAYARLDEYEKRGLLHVSEISSSWIRNIHDFVRDGQKLVVKVLRVDMGKGHIDLSLRRVTKRERIEKVLSWKKERKADALLRGVAEKLGLSIDEVYQKAGTVVEQKFDLYEGFEKAALEGPEPLIEIGMPEIFAKAEMHAVKPNGIKVIKEAFHEAKAEKIKDAKITFYVIAAPKYNIEVQAENYKRAEEVMQKTADTVITNIAKAGGQGSFRREK